MKTLDELKREARGSDAPWMVIRWSDADGDGGIRLLQRYKDGKWAIYEGWWERPYYETAKFESFDDARHWLERRGGKRLLVSAALREYDGFIAQIWREGEQWAWEVKRSRGAHEAVQIGPFSAADPCTAEIAAEKVAEALAEAIRASRLSWEKRE